jgi:hypothetical protein
MYRIEGREREGEREEKRGRKREREGGLIKSSTPGDRKRGRSARRMDFEAGKGKGSFSPEKRLSTVRK